MKDALGDGKILWALLFLPPFHMQSFGEGIPMKFLDFKGVPPHSG